MAVSVTATRIGNGIRYQHSGANDSAGQCDITSIQFHSVNLRLLTTASRGEAADDNVASCYQNWLPMAMAKNEEK
jgi:hypothetical protein